MGDNGKENGNSYIIGYKMGGIILGLLGNNGKEHGNYYNGLYMVGTILAVVKDISYTSLVLPASTKTGIIWNRHTPQLQ